MFSNYLIFKLNFVLFMFRVCVHLNWCEQMLTVWAFDVLCCVREEGVCLVHCSFVNMGEGDRNRSVVNNIKDPRFLTQNCVDLVKQSIAIGSLQPHPKVDNYIIKFLQHVTSLSKT